MAGAKPLAWNYFDLTGTDQVAWQLLQALWPGSWKIKSRGAAAESNYLVSSPFGDTFDVLNEANSIKALPLYRAAIFTGNVTLGSAEVLRLKEWVLAGGTAVVFASQLSTAGRSAAASLVGASLQGQDNSTSKLIAVTDLETGWTQRRREPPSAKPEADLPLQIQHVDSHANPTATAFQAPFCAPEKVANTPPYYIKTGGDPSEKVGWRGPPTDKCGLGWGGDSGLELRDVVESSGAGRPSGCSFAADAGEPREDARAQSSRASPPRGRWPPP